MSKAKAFVNKWTQGWRLLLVVLLILSGVLGATDVRIGSSGPPDKGTFSIGLGEKNVIRIGSEAEAAGSVDYTFGVANANVQFQTALNALPATGGRLVVVSAVQVNWAALTTVTRAIDNVIVEGSGAGTYFVGDGATPLFTAGGNNWVFSNIRTDAGGLSMGATTGWQWNDVVVNATYYALRSPDGSAVARTIESTVATGTAPLTVSSTTLNTNLNADYVDGQHGAYYAPVASPTFTGTATAPTVNATTFTGPTGIPYVIAFSNSTDQEKAHADVIVTGSADDEIQAGIVASPNVYLCSGSGTLSAAIDCNVVGRATYVHGAGFRVTTLYQTNGSDIAAFFYSSAANNGISISDMMLQGSKTNVPPPTITVGVNGTNMTEPRIWNVEAWNFPSHGFYETSWTKGCASRENNGWGFYNAVNGLVGHDLFSANNIIGGFYMLANDVNLGFIKSDNEPIGVQLENGYPQNLVGAEITVGTNDVGPSIGLYIRGGHWPGAAVSNVVIDLGYSNSTAIDVSANNDIGSVVSNVVIKGNNGAKINQIGLNIPTGNNGQFTLTDFEIDNIGGKGLRLATNAGVWRVSDGAIGRTTTPISVEAGTLGTNWVLRGITTFVDPNFYRSENQGSATILTGTSSVVIDHALGYTPTEGMITLTPGSLMGDARYLYADTYTSANFTAHTDVDPNTANVTVLWKAGM